MSPTVYRAHIFHIAGHPDQADVTSHLVSLPDGALVVAEGGTVAWCGEYAALPLEWADAPVTRADYLIPGFVDSHVHFPQAYATAAHGGGRLLEWLDHCIFPTEARYADPAFADQAARYFTRRRIAAGTTAAMVFGSAFPVAQDALYHATLDAGLRIVSGRGVQTVGPDTASALMTSEAAAIEMVADEIARWHAVDTGDARTAKVQVGIVPRFSLSVTPTTLAAMGEPVRRGPWARRLLPLAPEREQPQGRRRDRRRAGHIRRQLLPRHLRRALPSRLEAGRLDLAGPPLHPRARGALPGGRVGTHGGDGDVDRSLPHLPPVPRVRDDALACHGGRWCQRISGV
ncbi:hypothetical protein GCM10025876_07990 [Demequina litorisediminis]|uniref:Amidohydrolase-related domain-containing protein n=1 Tax=Demequina litorisediminis TaxID=1849022 RepID=A0ABQ6IA36_9MICO|nr:hypothetical protein GCM10025876_07990 [Demequina litorisediminis]